MELLSGKVALVTGASKRIGRAVVLALADAGVHVVVHYGASKNEAEELADKVRNCNVNAAIVQADLRDPSAAEGLFAHADGLIGPVSLLVNNASIFPESTLDTVSRTAVQESSDVNTMAPFLIARAMNRTGRRGAIVNFLDCMIADYDKKHVAYHLSKRMLHTLTRIMAVDFAPEIRVNAVAPGLILPPEGKDMAYLEALVESNPLHKHGSPDDLAAAVLFLLQSDFITGEVIFVDGGRNLRGSMYG